MLEPRLGEEVGDRRALLVVAGPAPDHAAGLVQPLLRHGHVVVRAHDRLGEGQGLGVEVDVVPGGQRAAPVEDHGVDRHGGDPMRDPRRRCPPARRGSPRPAARAGRATRTCGHPGTRRASRRGTSRRAACASAELEERVVRRPAEQHRPVEPRQPVERSPSARLRSSRAANVVTSRRTPASVRYGVTHARLSSGARSRRTSQPNPSRLLRRNAERIDCRAARRAARAWRAGRARRTGTAGRCRTRRSWSAPDGRSARGPRRARAG